MTEMEKRSSYWAAEGWFNAEMPKAWVRMLESDEWKPKDFGYRVLPSAAHHPQRCARGQRLRMTFNRGLGGLEAMKCT